MNLPSITVPHFDATVPSTNQKIKYRPFLVKEEKLLLMALEGNNTKEINDAIVDILKVCIKDDINIDELSYFDIEYLFLRLRGKSVGEEIELSLKTNKCKDTCKPIKCKVNVDDVNVKYYDDHTNKIKITDEIGVVLKYPNLDTLSQVGDKFADGNMDKIFEVIVDSIDYIFDNDRVYKDATKEEINQFLENFNSSQFQKIIHFFKTMPKLSHTINFGCPMCNTKDEVLIEGLNNFFT